jgi:hypothetical protein
MPLHQESEQFLIPRDDLAGDQQIVGIVTRHEA